MILRPASVLAAAVLLGLPTVAEARCVVWNALRADSTAELRNLAVRFDGQGGVELAHLGVADAFRGAKDCELSVEDNGYTIYCHWDVDSNAEGERRINAMQRDIEGCLGTAMDQEADFPTEQSSMLFRRELDLEYGEVNSSFDLTLFINAPLRNGEITRSVVFDFEHHR